MKIIISPAKKMVECEDDLPISAKPVFLDKTKTILAYLKTLSFDELKTLWSCNDSIAHQNAERLEHINIESNLTPAILAYDGIAFKYMAPSVFTDEEFDYVKNHLYILSGFYGVLRALDGVTPYRLEMQAKVNFDGYKNLYDFWSKDIYDKVIDSDRVIINLASKEYSKCIEKYLTSKDKFITCTFCEEVNGKLVQKGTFAKMARGEMVRFLAEHNSQTPDDMKNFNRLGYIFRSDLSNETEYIFERVNK